MHDFRRAERKYSSSPPNVRRIFFYIVTSCKGDKCSRKKVVSCLGGFYESIVNQDQTQSSQDLLGFFFIVCPTIPSLNFVSTIRRVPMKLSFCIAKSRN